MTSARTQTRLRLSAQLRPALHLLQEALTSSEAASVDIEMARGLVLARIRDVTLDGYPVAFDQHRTPGRTRSMRQVAERFDVAISAIDDLLENPSTYGVVLLDDVSDPLAARLL